jgi:plasmid stabilization system protein ParE
MRRRLVVEPEVDADVAAAEAWYRQRSTVAANSFPEDVRQTLRLIQDNPYQYQTIFGRYRRAMLRQFPYALIYAVTETEIVVLACMHGRRHPTRWQDRIRG